MKWSHPERGATGHGSGSRRTQISPLLAGTPLSWRCECGSHPHRSCDDRDEAGGDTSLGVGEPSGEGVRRRCHHEPTRPAAPLLCPAGQRVGTPPPAPIRTRPGAFMARRPRTRHARAHARHAERPRPDHPGDGLARSAATSSCELRILHARARRLAARTNLPTTPMRSSSTSSRSHGTTSSPGGS